MDAFITSRIDYCIALVSGISSYVQNDAAARVLTRTKKHEQITPVLEIFLDGSGLILRSCF